MEHKFKAGDLIVRDLNAPRNSSISGLGDDSGRFKENEILVVVDACPVNDNKDDGVKIKRQEDTYDIGLYLAQSFKLYIDVENEEFLKILRENKRMIEI